ncbi:hypothetical protein [Pedobacter cryoconitis]|uniref:hypothetical protein n=1 Tax=Pedobacter cryoconitis TaxID=188932 RepID=UPI0011B9397A|nr:hypothetical protein [Pedobacter cryoconitis]
MIFLFSMVLFFGFGLKATVSVGKWSAFYLAMEDESLADEEKNTKKEKSDRSAKKMWYLESPETDQLWLKISLATEAHNKVYLLAKLSEPHIAISTEPPENAAGFLRV